MKEPERHTVDEVAVAVVEHLTPVEIPVGDVVAGILEDVVIEKRGHEVHPALIGEHHARDIDQRLAARGLPPPVEERPRGAADGDEPEIVDPRREHEEAVDLPLVLRERPHRVRREHDAVHGGEIGDRLERVEDLDVGVEVDDLARTAVE